MKGTKRYDKVFKSAIVELHKNGKSIAQLSREYGISKQSIGSWVKLTKKVGKIAGEKISYKELLELRKKVKDLEEDNDTLKNMLAIFISQREKNNEGIEKTAKLFGIPRNNYY